MNDGFLGTMVIACAALLVGLVALTIHESNKWEEFKVAHKCKVVGKMSGDVFNTFGVGANGQLSVGIGATSGKTGWACDDGMTYWK